MNLSFGINAVYLLCSVCFILGLKLMSSPKTARRGNLLSSVGMLLAIGVTLLDARIVRFQWILVGIASGSALGFAGARLVPMTAMPQMVALLNGFGGGASLLLGWSTYHVRPDDSFFGALSIILAVVIGGVTFTGSLLAFAKLDGRWMKGRPVFLPHQKKISILLSAALLVSSALFCAFPVNAASYALFLVVVAGAAVLGVLLVNPIGGADMPVVISLLNSYSGLAACAAGFVINNNLLIVAGALVGASGIILTGIMCKAMNRSLGHVLFSGFQSEKKKCAGAGTGGGEVKPISPADAYILLEAARSVVIVPGYGLAVAQAQHVLRELGELLERGGAEVRYAIHPVAGRMPGHMNVLLAEANVSYEQLSEMDAVNPQMDSVDVCLVVGANDVVNLAARDDPEAPISGMPVIHADRARTVLVVKRSTSPGFSGVDNPLFYRDNTRMLFGDAKSMIQALVSEFKE
jgi:NAD(P) transhydrogenase subunit beta